MNILDLLLPREIKFYTYLNDQASNLHQAARQLNEFIQQKDGKQHLAIIKGLEKKGDRIERFIINQLDQTFITPFDREDIHALVIALDNILDILYWTAHKFEIYKINNIPNEVKKFVALIVIIADKLRKLIASMRERKNTKLYYQQIRQIESDADQLFHKTMSELFNKNHPPKTVIALKDIYEDLEEIINSIERIAKLIRGIMVKQG